jgi:hypothetical protein
MANRLAILIPGGRLLLATREVVYFNVDVKNRSGKITNWAFEGWLRDSLKVGDRVAYPSRDGESMGSAGDPALRRFIGSSL